MLCRATGGREASNLEKERRREKLLEYRYLPVTVYCITELVRIGVIHGVMFRLGRLVWLSVVEPARYSIDGCDGVLQIDYPCRALPLHYFLFGHGDGSPRKMGNTV